MFIGVAVRQFEGVQRRIPCHFQRDNPIPARADEFVLLRLCKGALLITADWRAEISRSYIGSSRYMVDAGDINAIR